MADAGGSKKLLWVMIVLVMLSSTGAAVAIYMVMNQDTSANEGAKPSDATAQRESPIFLQIEPFTVNLADSRSNRLLYAGISLRLGNEESREILEEHMPQVRSRLLTLASGMEAEALTSAQGKQQLAQDIIARLEDPLTENQPSLAIRDVLFTEFIVQ